MNIVFVNATRRFGGVKAWTLDLAQRLDEMGHHCTIFARPGPFLTKALAMGLDAHQGWFGCDYHPLSVWRYRRFFITQRTDVLVCNVGKDLRIAGVGARMAGVPVVHRVGLGRDMRDTPKVRNTHRFTRSTVLVPCQAIKDELLSAVSFLSPGDIHVILTGKATAAHQRESVHTPRRLCVTSQLNADKGHTDLLNALANLRQQGLDFRLDIAGTGHLEAELKALCSKLGLDDAINWLGFVTDVRTVLRNADIFALPSLSEGLPNTLLEAMAEGLPPVARNVGGISEAWPSHLPPLDKTLVPRHEGHEALQEALEQLLGLSDETLAALKSDVGKWFADNHSLDVRTKEFETFIQGLCTS